MSPKAHCNVFIDDLGFNVPLAKDDVNNEYERPYVDWAKVREAFGFHAIKPRSSV